MLLARDQATDSPDPSEEGSAGPLQPYGTERHVDVSLCIPHRMQVFS